MKVAFIVLPENNIPVNSLWTNLHDYWQPPDVVIEFWDTACRVEYINELDYELKKEIILNSYDECINKHYREFVY